MFSDLQEAFDKDWDEGRITYEGWYTNASENGVMAYKLLAQTGEKETINRSIVCFTKLNNISILLLILNCIVYMYMYCRIQVVFGNTI